MSPRWWGPAGLRDPLGDPREQKRLRKREQRKRKEGRKEYPCRGCGDTDAPLSAGYCLDCWRRQTSRGQRA